MDALPDFRSMLAGMLTWALSAACCAAIGLWLHNRFETPEVGSILSLYFLGGAGGYALGVPVAHVLSANRRVDTRFAAFALALASMTISFTAAIYAIQYREFYAQWHDAFPSKLWFLQFIFTVAGAVYQFAVIGIRLYFPHGILLLALTSLILARRSR